MLSKAAVRLVTSLVTALSHASLWALASTAVKKGKIHVFYHHAFFR
jgi:hypothetical protein